MAAPKQSVRETKLTYPQGFPQMLKMTEGEFVEEIRFLAAAKLYELGRLTAGKAAQLAEMERLDFIYRLGKAGVPAINLQGDDIGVEIRAAKELAG